MENSKRFSSAITATAIQTDLLYRQCSSLFPDSSAIGIAALDLNALTQEASAGGRESLAACFLIDTERNRMASFSSQKRQIEWLGGRIAAKTAIRSLLARAAHPGWHDLEVAADTSGRPRLSNACLPGHDIDVSISHSGTLAASVCCMGGTCGLDIQKITPTVERVKERFASEDEITILRSNELLGKMDQSAVLTLLWSAKEAFRKAVQCEPLLGFLAVRLTDVVAEKNLGMTGHFTCNRDGVATHLIAHLSFHDNYTCAITVLPASA